jgi:UPF0755 protein
MTRAVPGRASPHRLRVAIIRLSGILLAALLVFLAVVADLDLPTRRSRRGPGKIHVPPGATLGRVAVTLADSGWVREPRLVSLWARHARLDRKVLPGRYRLARGWSPREVVVEIASGRVETTRLTIPEGWREERTLNALADSLEIPRAEVRRVAADTSWILSLGLPRPGLEGYLFPETYVLPKEYEARAAIREMIRESDARFDSAMRSRAERLGWTRDQVVILASIVQAEAARSEEMPRIAAVFRNRLREGWKLEADPTVLYALGRTLGPVLYKDLEVESPYNTYRAGGLPPGPIDSPGTDALRAVLWPDSTRNEWYFVASGNGAHAFSRTLAEHNAKRRAFRTASGKGS